MALVIGGMATLSGCAPAGFGCYFCPVGSYEQLMADDNLREQLHADDWFIAEIRGFGLMSLGAEQAAHALDEQLRGTCDSINRDLGGTVEGKDVSSTCKQAGYLLRKHRALMGRDAQIFLDTSPPICPPVASDPQCFSECTERLDSKLVSTAPQGAPPPVLSSEILAFHNRQYCDIYCETLGFKGLSCTPARVNLRIEDAQDGPSKAMFSQAIENNLGKIMEFSGGAHGPESFRDEIMNFHDDKMLMTKFLSRNTSFKKEPSPILAVMCLGSFASRGLSYTWDMYKLADAARGVLGAALGEPPGG